jgi:hypothetical protein
MKEAHKDYTARAPNLRRARSVIEAGAFIVAPG